MRRQPAESRFQDHHSLAAARRGHGKRGRSAAQQEASERGHIQHHHSPGPDCIPIQHANPSRAVHTCALQTAHRSDCDRTICTGRFTQDWLQNKWGRHVETGHKQRSWQRHSPPRHCLSLVFVWKSLNEAV